MIDISVLGKLRREGVSKAEDKVLLTIFLIVSLAVLPLTAYAQNSYSLSPEPYSNPGYTGQQYPGAPPVEQPLVSEGVFAVELAKALNNGQVQDETQAENWLSSMGIEPSNGWIGDYPMTPDIVAEIENSVGANQLPIGNEDALRTVADVLANLGLSIQPGSSEGIVGEPESPLAAPAVVNNYYNQYGGPPVVTYYAPPPDYTYLYAWVPYPFWFGGFFFNGFFVLHDFHRHVHFHDRDFVVSNHFFNPRTHRVFVVDPRGRFDHRTFVGFDSRRDFHSPGFQHSPEVMTAHNRSFTPHSAPAMPERNFHRGFPEGGGFHQGISHSGGFHGGGFGGFHGAGHR